MWLFSLLVLSEFVGMVSTLCFNVLITSSLHSSE